jgi:hypothetical protein
MHYRPDPTLSRIIQEAETPSFGRDLLWCLEARAWYRLD